MNSVRPSSNTGSVNSSTVKKYKIFNYWTIFNGAFLLGVYLVYYIGGTVTRDKLIYPLTFAQLQPLYKEKYRDSKLIWNISVLLFPVIIALFFFGILIWFYSYKRHPMMPSILAYGSILPIFSLYIWRCYITVIDTSKKMDNVLNIDKYFKTLFIITS